MTSYTLMERSVSSEAAARTPGFQRSSARGWSWLLTPAHTRPSGAPGSFLIVMGSVLLGVFFEAQERADRSPGLIGIGRLPDPVERGHSALDRQHRGVAAHRLAVLELAHFVAGEDSVVHHRGVERGAAGAVSAQQALHGELRVVARALRRRQQVLLDRLLDPAQPRRQSERQEPDHLLLQPGAPVRILLPMSDQRGVHAEPAADLFDTERPGFQQLRVRRLDADRADVSAALEQRRLAALHGAQDVFLELCPLGRLQELRDLVVDRLQHPVAEGASRRAVRGDGTTEHVRAVLDHRDAGLAVEREPRNLPDAVARNDPLPSIVFGVAPLLLATAVP